MTTLALSTPASPSHQATGWDRAAITALGGAGCALSYDALQQMATAIHVRGFLTYLFPLVIDGFIAYGVRALLVLRTASFGARLYVWTLFGTATAASIWANALHAIRLNQQDPPEGLHLGDATVGVLPTLAPLALAGAVHLHILVARHTATTPEPKTTDPVRALHRTAVKDADQNKPGSDDGTAGPRRIGRPPTADLDELVELARPLFTPDEAPTRDAVRRTIRTAGHRISQDRLTQVMNALRQPSAEPAETIPSG